MVFYSIVTFLLIFGSSSAAWADEQILVPDQVYPGLEYVLELSRNSESKLEQGRLNELINFVRSTPSDTSMSLKKREGAAGAFHAFSIQGDLSAVLDYAYNPDVPVYVTMPSSLQDQQWLTPEIDDTLRNLPRSVDSVGEIFFLRGKDRETITPDTNTGGYYSYNQDRLVIILPGPTGPALISVSVQADISEVGKKGCVVGNDANWNYLYSNDTGLNKGGLGWVSSYMYTADSVLVVAADSSKNTLHVGSFKWLDAGWARINMVKSSHILNGIKRFASDFKMVMESPGLPEATTLAAKYRELEQSSDHQLKQSVSPYLQALAAGDSSQLCSSPSKSMVTSGEYLEQMGREEMIRILFLDYMKGRLGKTDLATSSSETTRARPAADQPRPGGQGMQASRPTEGK